MLKITEIQISGVGGEQYIEVHNDGHAIDMSQIAITGVASGTVAGTSQQNRILSQGNIAVIYNTEDSINQNIPNCGNCTCSELTDTVSEGAIKWCDATTTIYLGCCVGGGCSNNYGFEEVNNCQFNTVYTMGTFTLGLDWTNPDTLTTSTIQSLAFDTSKQ